MLLATIKPQPILAAQIRNEPVRRPLIPMFLPIRARVIVRQRRRPRNELTIVIRVFDVVEFTDIPCSFKRCQGQRRDGNIPFKVDLGATSIREYPLLSFFFHHAVCLPHSSLPFVNPHSPKLRQRSFRSSLGLMSRIIHAQNT